MHGPKVTFVVPCYKLGHLLGECLNSILSQSYRNCEILVMDDDSPDETAQVAASFQDCRVRHVRNHPNLGHLRNYNKGIELSSGTYIWLISADDYLRSPYVLERYIAVMERNARVGYAFCPGVAVVAGRETAVLAYSQYGNRDRVIDGRVFIKRLLRDNCVVAASVLVRSECYDKIGRFPLDPGMEWSGDWYLWCAFALSYDVAYFAEPMVCYRAHELSMTTALAREENLQRCSEGDLAVPLMIRRRAEEMGLPGVSRECFRAIAAEYVHQCRSKRYQDSSWSMSLPQFEDSLCRSIDVGSERDWIRARVFEGMGDNCWARGDRLGARAAYLEGMAKDPRQLRIYAKLLLVCLGIPGGHARGVKRYVREFIAGN